MFSHRQLQIDNPAHAKHFLWRYAAWPYTQITQICTYTWVAAIGYLMAAT